MNTPNFNEYHGFTASLDETGLVEGVAPLKANTPNTKSNEEIVRQAHTFIPVDLEDREEFLTYLEKALTLKDQAHKAEVEEERKRLEEGYKELNIRNRFNGAMIEEARLMTGKGFNEFHEEIAKNLSTKYPELFTAATTPLPESDKTELDQDNK